MSVGIEELDAVRTAAVAQLQALLALTQPTVTTAAGEVPWAPWLASLRDCVDWCDRKLTESQPYELRSQGHG